MAGHTPWAALKQALEAHAATLASERPPTGGPARARRDPINGAEVPWESGRLTFPATVTSHPTPPQERTP